MQGSTPESYRPLGEQLPEEAAPSRSRVSRKTVTVLSVLMGLGVVLFLSAQSSDPADVQEPSIAMALKGTMSRAGRFARAFRAQKARAEVPHGKCMAPPERQLDFRHHGMHSTKAEIARNIRAFADNEYGASGTSFYTTTEKQDSYDDLDKVLDEKMKDPQVKAVIKEMLDAIGEITEALRSALVTVEGSSNTFGDQQLSVDVIADEIMWNACKASKTVKFGASEEEPEVKQTNPDGEFTVCWDPLDGSSIVDNNWAVGTMIGIWGSKSGTGEDGLLGATGRDQVTSLVALYGPRTTVLVALDDGVYEFSYGCTPEGCALPDGTFAPWICSRKQITISPDCKIFAPANMRAAKEVEGYKKLIDHYMDQKFTLRYTGGLVPDVYQQFTKQQGVFSNPTSESSPAKLRLAFEASPFGLLVEKAGGKTSDGVSGCSILDVKIEAVDQRTALCIGSANEVERFNEMICMVGGE